MLTGVTGTKDIETIWVTAGDWWTIVLVVLLSLPGMTEVVVEMGWVWEAVVVGVTASDWWA